MVVPEGSRYPTASTCGPFREVIEHALAQGRTAKAILAERG
jgi:hypothetical protein